MPAQLRPQRLVGDVRVPHDRARVRQRHLLALGEPGRFGEIQEVVVLLFRQPLPSGLDGALYASVFALDRLRDVHAAELLDRVIADALAKRQLPGLGEGADHTRIVGANRLALRTRRSLAARALEVAENLRVGHRRGIDVGNMRHGSSSEARLGWRGPSPATSCGSHYHTLLPPKRRSQRGITSLL